MHSYWSKYKRQPSRGGEGRRQDFPFVEKGVNLSVFGIGLSESHFFVEKESFAGMIFVLSFFHARLTVCQKVFPKREKHAILTGGNLNVRIVFLNERSTILCFCLKLSLCVWICCQCGRFCMVRHLLSSISTTTTNNNGEKRTHEWIK